MFCQGLFPEFFLIILHYTWYKIFNAVQPQKKMTGAAFAVRSGRSKIYSGGTRFLYGTYQPLVPYLVGCIISTLPARETACT